MSIADFLIFYSVRVLPRLRGPAATRRLLLMHRMAIQEYTQIYTANCLELLKGHALQLKANREIMKRRFDPQNCSSDRGETYE